MENKKEVAVVVAVFVVIPAIVAACLLGSYLLWRFAR